MNLEEIKHAVETESKDAYDIAEILENISAPGISWESWSCKECGHTINQWVIEGLTNMVFNGNEGDGWQILPSEPLPESEFCNNCA